MNKPKRYILISVLTLVVLYILTLFASFAAQKDIHHKYSVEFNDERAELGVYPIGDFTNIQSTHWADIYPDDPLIRWKEILTNTEIANSTVYSNPNKSEPFHAQKTIYFGTQLCFWNNSYGGEIDIFIKPLDEDRHIELFVAYYSEALAPNGYFYAELDTVYKDRVEFICGGVEDHEHDQQDYLPKGNFSKEQADSLLTEWRLKTSP